MPRVFVCNRCTEKIHADTQDWVVVPMDTAGTGLDIRPRRVRGETAEGYLDAEHAGAHLMSVAVRAQP